MHTRPRVRQPRVHLKMAYYYLYNYCAVRILHGSMLFLQFFNSWSTGYPLLLMKAKEKRIEIDKAKKTGDCVIIIMTQPPFCICEIL